jgi:hypothetical protein
MKARIIHFLGETLIRFCSGPVCVATLACGAGLIVFNVVRAFFNI